jgi:hypothetical protein
VPRVGEEADRLVVGRRGEIAAGTAPRSPSASPVVVAVGTPDRHRTTTVSLRPWSASNRWIDTVLMQRTLITDRNG